MVFKNVFQSPYERLRVYMWQWLTGQFPFSSKTPTLGLLSTMSLVPRLADSGMMLSYWWNITRLGPVGLRSASSASSYHPKVAMICGTTGWNRRSAPSNAPAQTAVGSRYRRGIRDGKYFMPLASRAVVNA